MTPEESTKKWIDEMVVGLGLCPFASKVVTENAIRFQTTKSSSSKELTTLTLAAAEHILSEDNKETTAIIIIEEGLSSFTEYLDIIYLLEEHLAKIEMDTDIQIASFHPDYQFAETTPDDISNYTNKSPYPLIHLLRCDDVEKAIEGHPDIHSVPVNNIKKLKEMTTDSLAVIYKSFRE